MYIHMLYIYVYMQTYVINVPVNKKNFLTKSSFKILSGVRYVAEAAQQQAGPDVLAAAAETQADRKLNSLQASSGNEEKEKG